MKLNGLLTTLLDKKKYHTEQLAKIDAAISSLKGIDGLDDEVTKKALVVEKSPKALRYGMSVIHPTDFAREYIRKKGAETSLAELFDAYSKKIDRSYKSGKEKTKFYNRFCANFSSGRAEKNGFYKKLYKLEGVGRQAYLNLNSAISLHTEKVVQNPNVNVKEMKID